MTEFKTNLSTALIFDGSQWLNAWLEIPMPPPKRYDMPPRGAAGSAVITYAWTAETLLYWAVLRAKLDKGAITAEVFQQLRDQPAQWKELGSDEALKIASELPEKYRDGVLAYLLYGRFSIRRMYKQSRPATATAPWVKPNGAPPTGESSEEILDTIADFLGFSPTSSAVVLGWVWPILVLGIAGTAALAWYGSKRAEAGVAIEAERAHSFARAWRDIKIAMVQAASGQKIEVADFVSRGAQIEAFQTSPLLIGGTAIAAAGVAGGSVAWALSQGGGGRKKNPSHRRTRKCVGRDVEVSKYASGFRAWLLEGKKRGRSIDVKGARTYDDAFKLACADIRKRKRKNPDVVVAVANPKKRKKAKTTKPRKKSTKRKTAKKKTAKRKTAKKKSAKKKSAKKKSTKKRNPAITKEAFIRRQMRKKDKRGRKTSRAQAEAQWKGARRMKGASGKEMRVKAKRARKK